jgi:hypothetical protein
MQWNQVKNVRENQCAYNVYDLYIIYIYILWLWTFEFEKQSELIW